MDNEQITPSSEVCGENKSPVEVLRDKTKPLNGRQERFCIEYVKCPNATQAAILAGYSKDTAKEQGYKLLKDIRISSLITTKKNELHKVLLKDRSTFLSEVGELKALCRDKGRINELIKLMQLEADVLSLTKPDQSSQQINVFGSLERLEKVLAEKKEVINIGSSESS